MQGTALEGGHFETGLSRLRNSDEENGPPVSHVRKKGRKQILPEFDENPGHCQTSFLGATMRFSNKPATKSNAGGDFPYSA